MIDGDRVVNTDRRVQGKAERDGLAGSDKIAGGPDLLGGEVVQRPPVVVFTPVAPGADGVEQLSELGGAQIHAGGLISATIVAHYYVRRS